MPEPPESLLEAYHQRCNVEGVSLEEFLDDARHEHDAGDLLALLERVERDIIDNIVLMLQARPELEAMAEERAQRTRVRMARLRASLED